MLKKLAPAVVLSGSVLIGVFVIVSAILLAVRQPWLGLRLAADESGAVKIVAINSAGPSASLQVGGGVVSIAGNEGEPVVLTALDLVEEPDVAECYVAFAEFITRQRGLSAALRSGTVTLALDDGGRVELAPADIRPLSSLPAVFWVQLVVGGGSFLIGAWVWSLKRHDLPARILTGVGLATMPALRSGCWSGKVSHAARRPP